MIQHIVCFRFKAEATPEAIQAHMDSFRALKDAIPQIASYRAGPTLPGDSHATPDYDVVHYLTYRTRADLDAYEVHPAHRAFGSANRDLWDDVLVINTELDGQE